MKNVNFFLKSLEEQIYQLSMDEIFSKTNGLPHEFFTRIKKMKMSDSTKICSICLNQFFKGFF